MNLRNVKISVKLFLSFLAASLLGITVFYFAFSSYTKAADDLFYAHRMDNVIFEEEIGLWQFMAGIEEGKGKYLAAREKMKKIEKKLEGDYGAVPEKFSPFFAGEGEVSGKLKENNFFEEMLSAREGFTERNSKHIRRLLGYIESWAKADHAKRIKALFVLDLIRQERIYLDEFNPSGQNASEIISRFREVNDKAVTGLVEMWESELKEAAAAASDTEMKTKLSAFAKIVNGITATGFPPVSGEYASLLGIAPDEKTRLGQEAFAAARALNASCDGMVSDYEKKTGERIWERAEVSDVGKAVTPAFVLGKIVSCQQELRVNAEDLFRLKLFFVNELDPALTSVKEGLNELIKNSSGAIQELASRLKNSFVTASAAVIALSILIWLFISFFVIKPILRVRDAASEIAKGNMDVEIDVSGRDEVAKLAQAIAKMRDSLKMVFEEYEKKIKEKEGGN